VLYSLQFQQTVSVTFPIRRGFEAAAYPESHNMKLIVAGATGYVGQEVIRQSLGRSDITSVVALARKPVEAPKDLPNGADASKLKSVTVKDYDQFPDDVKKELAGAGACIWTIAVTPGKARAYSFDEVTRISQTSAVVGINAIYEAGPARPFRFLYMSGDSAERDQSKKPLVLGQYLLMRGEAENLLLKFAAEHEGVEVAAAKPSLIYAPNEFLKSTVMAPLASVVSRAPSISTVDLTRAMLDQVVGGFEKDALRAADLVRLSAKKS
jgi:nucleoside-diphosphate-sugar epimerase